MSIYYSLESPHAETSAREALVAAWWAA